MKIARPAPVHVPPPRLNKREGSSPAGLRYTVQDPRRYTRVTRRQVYRPFKRLNAIASPISPPRKGNPLWPVKRTVAVTPPKSGSRNRKIVDPVRLAKGYEAFDGICMIKGFKKNGDQLITSDLVEPNLATEIDGDERVSSCSLLCASLSRFHKRYCLPC